MVSMTIRRSTDWLMKDTVTRDSVYKTLLTELDLLYCILGRYLSTRSTLVPDNADWPDTSWQPQGDQDNILKVVGYLQSLSSLQLFT